jgi:hemerythrin superfamily protein
MGWPTDEPAGWVCGWGQPVRCQVDTDLLRGYAMSDAAADRAQAMELPEDDVIRVLLLQHARIRDLFDEIGRASGDAKQDAFDELRALLAVHETAEEMVLRPVTERTAGAEVAKERNDEEAEANEVLKKLERLDVGSAEFDRELTSFQQSVDEHAEAEENDEFPAIMEACNADERVTLGRRIRAVESLAPTHPHPTTAGSRSATAVAGPFASLVDRVRDALTRSGG